MDIASLAIFAAALFVVAASPGPSIAALVARVIARGWRDVLPFLAGLWLGEAVWLSLAVFGLVIIAESFHNVFAALKWAGIAYMLWLAWRMWTAPVVLEAGALPGRHAPAAMFAAGMAVTLGNPKAMVFYVALLPAIIDLTRVTLLGWAELTLAMLLVLAAVDLTWVLAATQARRLLRSQRAVRAANRVSAGVMAGAAAAIASR
ncbi:MAG: LysE family translocator [Pseudomonadota bacterium]|nr:LysE family translocator [Pseudomonadota bacterium]